MTHYTVPAAPTADSKPVTTGAKDPKCKGLRKKLKRQQKGLAKATTEKKRPLIAGNIKDSEKRLKKLGC
jgi:hypothetical protein